MDSVDGAARGEQLQAPPPASVPQAASLAILTVHCCTGGSCPPLPPPGCWGKAAGMKLCASSGGAPRCVRGECRRLTDMSHVSQAVAPYLWGIQAPLQGRSCAAMGRHDRAGMTEQPPRGTKCKTSQGQLYTAAGGPGTAAQLCYALLQPSTTLPSACSSGRHAGFAAPRLRVVGSAHIPLPSLVLHCPTIPPPHNNAVQPTELCQSASKAPKLAHAAWHSGCLVVVMADISAAPPTACPWQLHCLEGHCLALGCSCQSCIAVSGFQSSAWLFLDCILGLTTQGLPLTAPGQLSPAQGKRAGWLAVLVCQTQCHLHRCHGRARDNRAQPAQLF